jgi:hypothetical protein
MPTLLLNYVYHNPVGHVVEALKVAKGYHDANPGLQIDVLLNQHAPVELARSCDWIRAAHAIATYAFLPLVPPGAGTRILEGIPREWDYIVTNDWILDDVRGMTEVHRDEAGMVAFHEASRAYFRARAATSPPDFDLEKGYLERIGLGYRTDAWVRLPLPGDAVRFAEQFAHDGPALCVMLGGSAAPRAYPSSRSWVRILQALHDAIPNLRIYLTGVRRSEEGRTATEAFGERQIQTVLRRVPDTADCYDIGLWRQLALVARTDVFLSPHTGFGFVTACVGTPWLTLSGGNWAEAFWNGAPFYSVLPDDPHFPYRGKRGSMYAPGPRIPSMREPALARKIPEIIDGMRLLLDPSFTFEAALARYEANLRRANVDPDWKREFLKRVVAVPAA